MYEVISRRVLFRLEIFSTFVTLTQRLYIKNELLSENAAAKNGETT